MLKHTLCTLSILLGLQLAHANPAHACKIYRGWNTSGTPVANIRGDKIYRGWNTSGTPALNGPRCTPRELTFAAGALM